MRLERGVVVGQVGNFESHLPSPSVVRSVLKLSAYPSASREALAPARIPRLPAELALRLRVGRAAHLGGRERPRRLPATSRATNVGHPQRRASRRAPPRRRAATRERRGLVVGDVVDARARRARRRPTVAAAASSTWTNENVPVAAADDREPAPADLARHAPVGGVGGARGRRRSRSAGPGRRSRRASTTCRSSSIRRRDGVAERARGIGSSRTRPRP